MNNTFNNSSEENFNTAMKMSEEEYDYETLIGFLTSEIVEKQIAVLKLTEIKSLKDAHLLVSNLINQDGKVREVVAFKVNELIQDKKFTDFFLTKENYDIFVKAILDINGNVCRHLIEIVAFLKSNSEFSEYFCAELVKTLNHIFEEIGKIDVKDKRYVVSKINFQLYWSLEALHDFVELIEVSEIKNAILKSGEFYDYTIREKAAKILTKDFYQGDAELEELKEKLKHDTNYYVRRY